MSGPTETEVQLVEALGEIWNTFLTLPVEHPSDTKDFMDGIHVLQRLILCRSGRRMMKAMVKDQP